MAASLRLELAVPSHQRHSLPYVGRREAVARAGVSQTTRSLATHLHVICPRGRQSASLIEAFLRVVEASLP